MGDPRRLTESKDVIPVALYAKRDGSLEDAHPISFGLGLPPYDYAERVLTNSTTETYTFKVNGSGGTTVATVVIVYTDSTLETISTVTITRT